MILYILLSVTDQHHVILTRHMLKMKSVTTFGAAHNNISIESSYIHSVICTLQRIKENISNHVSKMMRTLTVRDETLTSLWFPVKKRRTVS